MLTTYHRHRLDEKSIAGKTKRWLEEKRYSQKLLVLLVLFGTSMLIGDGILTPAISGVVHLWHLSSFVLFRFASN